MRTPDGSIVLDRTGKEPGRGAYIHAAEGCQEVARKRRALDRALGVPISPALWAEVSNSSSPA